MPPAAPEPESAIVPAPSEHPPDRVSLEALLASDPQLSTITGMVRSVGIERLRGTNDSMTLLAPSDAAFADSPCCRTRSSREG
jgi:uncharacterized surface protein with fasciclin (FAS1) repeats